MLLGQESQTPPDVLMVNSLDCKIAAQAKKRWVATCTASYLKHDKFQHEPWSVSFPPRKSIVASAKDCDRWIAAVEKIQAARLPVDVNQLKEKK